MSNLIKISIFCFLAFSSKESKSQGLDSLNFVYQTILDDPEFVNSINLFPDIFCDTTLRYERISIWEPTYLKFQNVSLKTDIKESDCAIMKFQVTQLSANKYEIRCNISKVFPGEGCKRSIRVTYSGILKTNKKGWKFKKINIDAQQGLLNFI